MPRPNRSTSGTWLQTRSKSAQGLAVEFLFYPTFVQAAWSRTAFPAVRARVLRESPDLFKKERILLDDSFLVEGSSMIVRVSLVPAREQEHYHMRIEVTSPQTIARSGRVILNWGSQEYVLPLRNGTMLFEDISPPDFSRLKKNVPSRDLRIRIEFDSHGKNGTH
jgi:hypothetical protein